jgi:hypothetical protein
MDGQEMEYLPNGVSRIKNTTLLISTFLLIFSIVLFTFRTNLPLGLIVSIPLFAVAVSGIALSIYVTRGYRSRRLWGAFMAHWGILLVLWLTWEFYQPRFWGAIKEPYFIDFFFDLGPIIYAIGCLAYFLTAAPRKYFHIAHGSDDGSRN